MIVPPLYAVEIKGRFYYNIYNTTKPNTEISQHKIKNQKISSWQNSCYCLTKIDNKIYLMKHMTEKNTKNCYYKQLNLKQLVRNKN